MDSKYFEIVLGELSEFFNENGFKNLDGVYSDGKLKAKIEYDEGYKVFKLLTAEEGEEEYKVSSSYLFDETENAKDAEAVGIDFLNTLRDITGIRVKRTVDTDGIDLPTSKSTNNISGFTKKVLDIFPQLKELYKASVAENGKFLYMNFFAVNLVPLIKETLKSGNKKQIKKLMEMLDSGFVNGDKDTSDIALAVLAAAVYKDGELKTAAINAAESFNYLKEALIPFIPVFEKDKKLVETLVK